MLHSTRRTRNTPARLSRPLCYIFCLIFLFVWFYIYFFCDKAYFVFTYMASITKDLAYPSPWAYQSPNTKPKLQSTRMNNIIYIFHYATGVNILIFLWFYTHSHLHGVSVCDVALNSTYLRHSCTATKELYTVYLMQCFSQVYQK